MVVAVQGTLGAVERVASRSNGVPAESRRAFNRPELDVLRFFAFFLVFCAHSGRTLPPRLAGLLVPGVFGVTLFFVLSAFLITELLRIERQRTGTIQVRKFYLRRILRIWPLFFAFIGAYWLKGVLQPANAIPNGAVLAFALFVGNFWTGRHGYPGPLGPLWSISVEEQFYLVWPTVMRMPRRWGIAFCCSLVPVAAIALLWLRQHGANPVDSVWTNTFVQAEAFGLGALLALWLSGRVPAIAATVRFVLVCAGICGFCLSVFVFRIHQATAPSTAAYIAGYLCAGLAACCLLYATLGYAPARRWSVLRYLGRISYGLYVFHQVVLWAVGDKLAGPATPGHWVVVTSLSFCITVCLAALSYHFLEAPFVHIKQRFAPVPSHTV